MEQIIQHIKNGTKHLTKIKFNIHICNLKAVKLLNYIGTALILTEQLLQKYQISTTHA